MSKKKHVGFHARQLCNGVVLIENGFHVCSICGWARRVTKGVKKPNLNHTEKMGVRHGA